MRAAVWAWLSLALILLSPAAVLAAGTPAMTVSGTIVVNGAPLAGFGTVQAFSGGVLADAGAVRATGGTFTGLQVAPAGAVPGQALSFTVDGTATSAVLAGCSPGGGTPGQAVTFVAGSACTVVLTVGGPLAGGAIAALSADTITSPGTATAGGTGSSVPSFSASASGGTGTIAVARYAGDPGPAPTFAATGSYYDLNIAVGGTFTLVQAQACGLVRGDQLEWLLGGTWVPVTSQSYGAGCLTATLSTVRSFPTVANLTGTVFAVAGPQSGAATAVPAVTGVSPASGLPGTSIAVTGTGFTGTSVVHFGGVPGADLNVQSDGRLTVSVPAGAAGLVDVTAVNALGASAPVAADQFTYTGPGAAAPALSAAGGVLGTADGAFVMAVPAGDLAGSLSLTESSAAPSGLPAGFTAASPVFTVAGGSLPTPAEAQIRYQASALDGLSPARSALYAEGSDGAWTVVPALVGSATLSVNVSGPVTLMVLANTAIFSDLPAGYWAKPQIDALLAAGVLSGFPDGTFQPGAAVTRAQFVKMLDIVMGLAPGPASGTGFTDVAATDWFAPYVAAAVQAGLVQGLTPTTFGPAQTVSREQLAVLLARALKLTGTQAPTFQDARAIDPYAAPAVEAAVAAGYLSGFPDGTFQPQGPSTRAQAAKVLAMAIATLAPAH